MFSYTGLYAIACTKYSQFRGSKYSVYLRATNSAAFKEMEIIVSHYFETVISALFVILKVYVAVLITLYHFV